MSPPCKNPWCKKPFEVTDFGRTLLDRLSPTIGGDRFQIPIPSLCPDCRQQRRQMWRNERTLYRRTCDLCEQSIIAIYPGDAPFPVYCSTCWWSDRWNPKDFGRDVAFDRPFFAQMKELQNVVPRMALNLVSSENSEFINLSGYCKNCYLLFAAEYDEDCLYGTQVIHSVGCIDALNCTESHYCYEVTDVEKCYDVSFAQSCSSCRNSRFLFDCRSCNDCVMCSNLRGKQYCVWNRAMSREEYSAERAKIDAAVAAGRLDELWRAFTALVQQSIHRATESVNCVASTGDYLRNCKSVQDCFDLDYGEDCAHIYTGFQVKDLCDVCHTTEAELGYESISLGYGSYNTLFTHGSWSGKNLICCDIVQSGTDMFGCVCMKKDQYCILNKQYSKEGYEELALRLIAHMQSTEEWGEFLPAFLAPFAYNETNAQFYDPLTKHEAIERGWKWQDQLGEPPKADRVIDASSLPTAIHDVTDDILNIAIHCESSNRPFKLIKQELEFYRSHGIPLPHLHPDERHRRRMMLRNPRKLFTRNCSKCGEAIQTTYALERPEMVVCEKCYLKEVY